MKKNQRRLVRLLAIVLAVLLGGSAIVSAIFSFAYAEEAMQEPSRNITQSLTIQYLEDEQALRMSQRLVYINDTQASLDRLLLYAPANLFRREEALLNAIGDYAASLPAGYLPGGIELMSVTVDGVAADYGFQGEQELYLRVACELAPGDSCELCFEYYLLLTANHAFLGVGENDLRLSDFYFAPAALDEVSGEFILNAPLSFTRWIHTPAADFNAAILLPEAFTLAATGLESCTADESGYCLWTIHAEAVHDFSLSLSRAYNAASQGSIRTLAAKKNKAQELLGYALEAVDACERWFGSLPISQMDICQSDNAASLCSRSGCAWLSDALIKTGGTELRRAVYFAVAQQYFGFSAYAQVSSDAWLSDSICEYLSYLILEEALGHEAYLEAINQGIVPSLQLTIPGGLNVVSDASLFVDSEYEIVVLDRGAAVFHELRTAMGRDKLISGLRLFYEMGLTKPVLGEMDLLSSLDEASGGSWEAFLTDWLYNIGDYVNQDIHWLD